MHKIRSSRGLRNKATHESKYDLFLLGFKQVAEQRCCSDKNLSDVSHSHERYKARNTVVPSVWTQIIVS